MRVGALMLLILPLSGCNRSDKAEVIDKDVYGEYEIADHSKSKNTKGAATHVVEIVQMKFIPDVVNVNRGDTVIWVNKDMVPHDVTELNTNLWSSSRMGSGASWKMVFNESQIYHCSLHMIMRGKIIVEGKDLAMMNVSSAITMCGSQSNLITVK